LDSNSVEKTRSGSRKIELERLREITSKSSSRTTISRENVGLLASDTLKTIR
jgi:hypothetical protein